MWISFVKKLLFVYFLYIAQSHSFDKLNLDKQSWLFTATDKTVPLVTTSYVGWEANWKWAGVNINPDPGLKDETTVLSYSGDCPLLDMNFTAKAKMKKREIAWDYNWDNKADHPNAIGLGIQFSLQLDSPAFNTPAQPPELLADNKGWRWQTPDGQSIEVTFTPALAKLYFERNQKNIIRAFFFGPVNKGNQRTKMVVKVSDNAVLADETALTYEKQNVRDWHRDILSEKASPVDLSFLNKGELPAGKHGFIKTKADKLEFEDGTPVKFWGANLMAYALFSTSDIDIKAHAKRIAQLGYNLIRIHHHDSSWVKPNIFKHPESNTQELSPEAFKKLDWWIKCLKEQGIYIWLDLHVGRTFTKADGVRYFDDIAKGKGSVEVKGFNYYNDSIQAQMQKFNEAYLDHVNAFTKLAYKSDPAVIALLITNENDLTQHFGNLFLPDKGYKQHNAIFIDDYTQFAKKTNLSADKVWLTWLMGESKLYLSDVEHRFNQKMITHLHSLGVKSLIATTNSWGSMGLFGLPSLTDGNIIDTHSYGRAEEFNYNPRFNPGFLTWIGGSQIAGKPLSVTEWNLEPFPVADRFTSALYTASIASLQGWDAMMLYGYSQHSLDGKMNGHNYSTYNDPSITGLMPAAALLYRQSHASPAKKNYELQLSEADFFYKRHDPTTSKTIRTLMETSRIGIKIPQVRELPWLNENTVKTGNGLTVSDPNQDFIPAGQDFVISDTGELKRDWSKGIHTVNTPKSQVASGWIGGNPIALKDVTFKISTKKATVAVQSLGDKPINKSGAIFITAIARSMPEKTSFLSEPVAGEISVAAPADLKLFPVDALGKKRAPIRIDYVKGRYLISLDKKNTAHWFILSSN